MKRYTLLYIVGVLCTFMNLSWAYASNPVKEGTNNPNIIEYHTIPKPLHFQRVAEHSPR